MATTITLGSGSGGRGTSTVTMICDVSSSDIGNMQYRPPICSNANSPLASDLVNLSSGANTVTVNTKTAVLIVVPPTDNAQTITLKGISGDTGIELSPKAPFMLSFDGSPPTSIILTAGGTVTGVQVLQF